MRKRKLRDALRRASKEEERMRHEQRQKVKARVSDFRQRQREQVEEEEEATESDVPRKIVTNLRACLDRNKGRLLASYTAG